MQEAKMVTKAQEKSQQTGIPLHKLLPPTSGSSGYGGGMASGPPSDYIQCPSCGRSFNQKAGERHIPQVLFKYFARLHFDVSTAVRIVPKHHKQTEALCSKFDGGELQ
jgi:hypothetical protein